MYKLTTSNKPLVDGLQYVEKNATQTFFTFSDVANHITECSQKIYHNKFDTPFFATSALNDDDLYTSDSNIPENLLTYFVILDFDSGADKNCKNPLKISSLHSELSSRNLQHIIYTTASHEENYECYRCIIPLLLPVQLIDYSHFKNNLELCDFFKFFKDFDNFDINATFRKGLMYTPGIINGKKPKLLSKVNGEPLDISLEVLEARDLREELEKQREATHIDVIDYSNSSKLEINNELEKIIINFNVQYDGYDAKHMARSIRKYINENRNGGDGRYNRIPKIVNTALRYGIRDEDSIIKFYTELENTPERKHLKNIQSCFITFHESTAINENFREENDNNLKPIINKKIETPKNVNNFNFTMKCGTYMSDIPDLIPTINKYVNENKIIFLSAPTCSGKTYLSLNCIKGNVILAAPYRSILRDVSKNGEIFPIVMGKEAIKDNNGEFIIKHNNPDFNQSKHVSTWDSLEKFFVNPMYCEETTLVIDEAHLFPQSTYRSTALSIIHEAMKRFKAVIIMSGTPSYFHAFDNITEKVTININKIGAPIKNVKIVNITTKAKKYSVILNEVTKNSDKVQIVYRNNKNANNADAKILRNNGFNVYCISSEDNDMTAFEQSQEPGTVIFVTSYVVCGYRLKHWPDIIHFDFNSGTDSPADIQQISERPMRKPDGSECPIMDVRIYVTPAKEADIDLSWDEDKMFNKMQENYQVCKKCGELLELSFNKNSKSNKNYSNNYKIIRELCDDDLTINKFLMITSADLNQRFSYVSSKRPELMKEYLEKYNSNVTIEIFADTINNYQRDKKIDIKEIIIEEIYKIKNNITSEIIHIDRICKIQKLRPLISRDNNEYKNINNQCNVINNLAFIVGDLMLAIEIYYNLKGNKSKITLIKNFFILISKVPEILPLLISANNGKNLNTTQLIGAIISFFEFNKFYTAKDITLVIREICKIFLSDCRNELDNNDLDLIIDNTITEARCMKIFKIFFNYLSKSKTENNKTSRGYEIVNYGCYNVITDGTIIPKMYEKMNWRSRNKIDTNKKSNEIKREEIGIKYSTNNITQTIINDILEINFKEITTIFDL